MVVWILIFKGVLYIRELSFRFLFLRQVCRIFRGFFRTSSLVTVLPNLEWSTCIFSLQFQDIFSMQLMRILKVVNYASSSEESFYQSTSTQWSHVGKIISQLAISIKTFLIRHLQYWVYNWTLKMTNGILFIEKSTPVLLLSVSVIPKLECLVNHLLIS